MLKPLLTIVAVLSSLFPTLALAGDVWGVATVASYHVHPKIDFNQDNPGLGLEYHQNNDVLYAGGWFKNSVYRESKYLVAGWTPFHTGPLSFGVAGGLISGYPLYHNGNFAPMAAGLIRLEGTGDWSRLGANMLVIPPIPSQNVPLTLGFQVKMRF